MASMTLPRQALAAAGVARFLAAIPRAFCDWPVRDGPASMLPDDDPAIDELADRYRDVAAGEYAAARSLPRMTPLQAPHGRSQAKGAP